MNDLVTVPKAEYPGYFLAFLPFYLVQIAGCIIAQARSEHLSVGRAALYRSADAEFPLNSGNSRRKQAFAAFDNGPAGTGIQVQLTGGAKDMSDPMFFAFDFIFFFREKKCTRHISGEQFL